MPTGHTDKQTLTAYRREVLQELARKPMQVKHVSAAKRHQIYNMVKYGWVSSDNCAGQYFRITTSGLTLLEEQS